MTPVEKAKELINRMRFSRQDLQELFVAQQCALIAVDEILEATPFSPHQGNYYETSGDRIDEAKEYWKQVKEEIIKSYP